METKELNQIPIREYLAELDRFPAKDRHYYGMYLSPFRAEHDPSMKVDYRKNLWYDFGAGEGGTMIDMVMKLENCTLKEAISKLEQRVKGVKSRYWNFAKPPAMNIAPLITITKIQPLANRSLIGYLKTRKINIEIASLHCPEVYYTVNDKLYYAVGFKNNSNGYELRNRYFKGCTSKDITIVMNQSRTCLMFEGFMDYLSYLTFNEIKTPCKSVIVLNSVNNLNKASQLIGSFDCIDTYLDNDPSGINALKILQKFGVKIHDKSGIYFPYKDYNEFLCSG